MLARVLSCYCLSPSYYTVTSKTPTVSPYILLLLYGIWRLKMIPVFGEILRRWYAEVSARPSLSGTHYGLRRHKGAKVGKWSAVVGKSAYGLVTHLAASIMLLYVGRAATEEQENNGKRYARQTSAKPRQPRILYAHNPEGRLTVRHLNSIQLFGSSPRLNIIPSGLCNRSSGPQPHRLFSLPHTIRIMLSSCVCAV